MWPLGQPAPGLRTQLQRARWSKSHQLTKKLSWQLGLKPQRQLRTRLGQKHLQGMLKVAARDSAEVLLGVSSAEDHAALAGMMRMHASNTAARGQHKHGGLLADCRDKGMSRFMPAVLLSLVALTQSFRRPPSAA